MLPFPFCKAFWTQYTIQILRKEKQFAQLDELNPLVLTGNGHDVHYQDIIKETWVKHFLFTLYKKKKKSNNNQQKAKQTNKKNEKKITLRIKSTTAILPAFQCTDYKLDVFGVFTTKTKTK